MYHINLLFGSTFYFQIPDEYGRSSQRSLQEKVLTMDTKPGSTEIK